MDAGFDTGVVDNDGDGFPADGDCDDTDPMVGAVATRSCTGECEGLFVQCTDGMWEECPPPAECVCMPGETRTLDCPMCGTQTQTCNVDGRWGEPGACEGTGECLAGSVDVVSPECGRCGQEERVCNATCMWDAPRCIEDESTCNAWLLRPGAAGWEGWRLSTASAPSEADAAWEVEGAGLMWVLDNASVHELEPSCMSGAGPATDCWIATAPVDRYFDADVDAPVHWGSTIPSSFAGGTEQGFDLFSSAFDHRFWRDVGTGDIRREWQNPAGSLDDPEAPPNDRTMVRAAFSRIGDTDGWVAATCGDPATAPTDFIAVIGPSAVHVFTPGDGCGYIEARPYAEFPPFALTGAPPLERVGASAYDAAFGLVVLSR